MLGSVSDRIKPFKKQLTLIQKNERGSKMGGFIRIASPRDVGVCSKAAETNENSVSEKQFVNQKSGIFPLGHTLQQRIER